jgi:S1-C subfamily serine protease
VAKVSAESPVKVAVQRSVFLRKSGCTGVLMGADRLVTAKHCGPDDAKAGDAYEGGKLRYISPTYDFAVVEFPNAGPAVERRTGLLGEHIFVVGYPVQLGNGEQELTVTDGLVAGPVDSDGQARITAPVYFGNSGGGVWSDRGELVGIAVAIYAVRIDGYDRPLPYVGQSYMVPVALLEGHL